MKFIRNLSNPIGPVHYLDKMTTDLDETLVTKRYLRYTSLHFIKLKSYTR